MDYENNLGAMLHSTKWHTEWRVILWKVMQRKPSELFFMVLNFVTSTQSRGVARTAQTMM